MNDENPYAPPTDQGKIRSGDSLQAARAFRLWQGASLIGLACPFWGCCCVFQPSWANGWPMAPFPVVFGASFAVVTFLAAFGLGGCLSWAATGSRNPEQITWRLFWVCILTTLFLGSVLAFLAFFAVYADPQFHREPFVGVAAR